MEVSESIFCPGIPVLNKVIIPVANYVVDDVVKPALNGLYQGLQTAYQAYQNFNRAYQDAFTQLWYSVGRGLQDIGNKISHLHITDVNKFIVGLGYCAATAGLIAATWEFLPEEAGGALALSYLGDATASVGFAHGLAEVIFDGAGIVGLGYACVSNIGGSISF